MKYVTFKQLKIKNFLSVGENYVTVDFSKGIHIITGINRDKEDRRNGVGKSTIADALYFAIFGMTLRDIKKDYISNNLTNGICEVQLTFNVNSPKGNNDFHIIRTLNPSKLIIYKDGIEKTRDSIANTNSYIEAILSSSPEIFQNCVILTLNNTVPFMAKSKIDKRKFIEQIFDLEVFSKMLSLLREEYNEVKRNFDIENTKYQEIDNTIISYNSQKESKLKDQEFKVNQLNTKIANNLSEIDNIKTQLSFIDKIGDSKDKEQEMVVLSNGYNQIEDRIKNCISEISEFKSVIKQKQDQVKKIGTDRDTCPVCLKTVDKHDHEHFNTSKKLLQSEISELETKLISKQVELKSFEERNLKIRKLITKINDEITNIKLSNQNKNSLSTRVEDLLALNKQIQENILQLNKEDDSFSLIIKQAEERLKTVETEIENIKKVLNMLDVVKFVVSEEGVKSFIVKKILQKFNSKLTFYLKKLDSNSICVFNEYFEEEILNEKGKICMYHNFSGAERKAIDLACLFSFMDMRKSLGDVHYNISIYDELLDSSIDEKGIDLVLSILKERCEKSGESVFIISHRKESIKAATGDIIFLEKRNGITRRVNFVD